MPSSLCVWLADAALIQQRALAPDELPLEGHTACLTPCAFTITWPDQFVYLRKNLFRCLLSCEHILLILTSTLSTLSSIPYTFISLSVTRSSFPVTCSSNLASNDRFIVSKGSLEEMKANMHSHLFLGLLLALLAAHGSGGNVSKW